MTSAVPGTKVARNIRTQGQAMTKTRNRKRPDRPLNERLKQFSRESRERARQLPIGKEREELIRRARQADEAAKLSQLFES